MTKKIYLICNETTGRFKIGFSKNPSSRVKSLQTGNDNVIVLYYERSCKHYSKVEANLKKDYAEFKTQGEWFEIPNISFHEIDTKVAKYDAIFESLKDNPFLK